jgi:hypothetical protein
MEVKTITAGVLKVAYLDYGPADGWPCIMGHGFPYDVHAYSQAAPILGESGARVIVPYLRGYGPTRFLSPDTPRSGESVAMTGVVGPPVSCRPSGLNGSWHSYPEVPITSWIQRGLWSLLRPQRKPHFGTSTIFILNAVVVACSRIGAALPVTYGRCGHRPGTSMTQLSNRPLRLSTTQISSTS